MEFVMLFLKKRNVKRKRLVSLFLIVIIGFWISGREGVVGVVSAETIVPSTHTSTVSRADHAAERAVMACPADTSPVTFSWDNGSRAGNVWDASDTENTYTLTYMSVYGAPTSVDINVKLVDPALNNYSAVDMSNSQTRIPHPFGDTDNSCGWDQNATGDFELGGNFDDPWDSDCAKDSDGVTSGTNTSGIYGNPYLTWFVNAYDHTEVTEFSFEFSKDVFIDGMVISDIDDSGYGHRKDPLEDYREEPGDSYQDEVLFRASAQAIDIPVNLSAAGSNIIVDTGLQSARAVYEPYQESELGPDDPAGQVTASTASPIDTFVIGYSNGPDDAAIEQSDTSEYLWWTGTGVITDPDTGATFIGRGQPPTNGVSDSHAIRLGTFSFCAIEPLPEVAIDKDNSAESAATPGDTITYTVTISNPSNSTLNDVVVTDTLPAGLTSVGGTTLVTYPGNPTIDNFADNFNTASYGNEDGSRDFDAFWVASDGADPTSGDISIVTDGTESVLQIFDQGHTMHRVVDLSTATKAVVSFDYKQVEMDAPVGPLANAEFVDFEISTNGTAGPFTLLRRFTYLDSTTFANFTLDISGYMSANTVIRFDTLFDTLSSGEGILIDNFNIDIEEAPVVPLTFQGGDPPNLVTASDGIRLYPTGVMTITYHVTVDDPIPVGQAEFVNTAGVKTNEISQSLLSANRLPVALGAISGAVTEDTDGDGVGDTPIAGVVLQLLDANGNPLLDVAGNPITTTTAADGSYSFGDLAHGDYFVVEQQPNGFEDVNEVDGGDDGDHPDNGIINNIPVTVDPGETDTGNDFVEERPGGISGVVTADTDGDGVGDTPLSGVVLELLDGNGNPVLDANGNPITTTTAADGSYSFSDLSPGDYTVLEQQPAGYVDVSEVDGGDDGDHPDNGIVNNIPVTVSPGETDTGNDFVEEQVGGISGTVTADTNNDDVGDTPLSGVVLELLDGNGNPVLDTNGNPITTTTAADGSYNFSDIPPGDYTVVEQQPAGYLDVGEVDGGDDGDNPDNGIVNNIPITVDAGETDTGNDFVEELPGAISGTVTEDTDGDDVGDTPLFGVVLELLDDNGNPVLDVNGNPITTTTAADGTYSFNDLPPGDYTVVEQQPTNYFDVSEVDGGDDGDHPDNGIVNNIPVTVDAGETDTGNDFVEDQFGGISGAVTADTDGDGVGDTPLSGVVLELLDDTGNSVLDANGDPITTTTAADGSYIFNDVPPGEYTIVEQQPSDHIDVSEVDGGDDGDNPDNGIVNNIPVTVDPGEIDTGNDFVEEQLGSISGTVTIDSDNDGLGDTPLSNVVLELLDGNGNPVLDQTGAPITTTTAADGSYIFSDVPAGEYVIVEQQPNGYLDVSEVDGGDDGDHSDNGIINNIPVTVDAGETDTGNDFVEMLPGAITGTVWLDTNEDNVGDSPIWGVVLELMDANGNPVLDASGNPLTTTTGIDGYYEFPDVVPGDYFVIEQQPNGFDDLTEIDGGDDGDHPDNGIINNIPVTVDPGESDSGNDFVEMATPTTVDMSVMEVNSAESTPSATILFFILFALITLLSFTYHRSGT